MIVALGLLIDNAIVVADEVARHKSAGVKALEAVEKAVRHLFLPLLASSITTILAFAPILMLPGGPGDFVSSIGSTVIIAIVASFIVSITIIAALAGLFASPVCPSGSRWWQVGLKQARIKRTYQKQLGLVLRYPWSAILIAI